MRRILAVVSCGNYWIVTPSCSSLIFFLPLLLLFPPALAKSSLRGYCCRPSLTLAVQDPLELQSECSKFKLLNICKVEEDDLLKGGGSDALVYWLLSDITK